METGRLIILLGCLGLLFSWVLRLKLVSRSEGSERGESGFGMFCHYFWGLIFRTWFVQAGGRDLFIHDNKALSSFIHSIFRSGGLRQQSVSWTYIQTYRFSFLFLTLLL